MRKDNDHPKAGNDRRTFMKRSALFALTIPAMIFKNRAKTQTQAAEREALHYRLIERAKKLSG